MEIGERIRKLRNEQGLTLKQLAEKSDLMSVSFLSDIENDRSLPSLERLCVIADALETSISFILGESLDSKDSFLDAKIIALKKNPGFLEVLTELINYDSWEESDRQELLYYLKGKKIARQQKQS